MKTFQIDIPNDYNSEEDTVAALIDCYEGDEEACKNDNGQQLYEELACQAKKAGLTFVKSTDFGATWSGTDAQFAVCVEMLPSWAKRYASKCESRGGHRNGAGRKPTGKAMAMFHIRVPAELKAQLAKVDPEKIRMELSKIVAPE
jgi:hypothetical protein